MFSGKWHRPNRFGQLFFKIMNLQCELWIRNSSKKVHMRHETDILEKIRVIRTCSSSPRAASVKWNINHVWLFVQTLRNKHGVYVNERASSWVNLLFTHQHTVKLLCKLNLFLICTKSDIIVLLSDLVLEWFRILPARFGFGRCEASFDTWWEETLCICPKPTLASSDNSTTQLLPALI